MSNQRKRRVECPHCGETFAAGRLACPECGSDAETGWRAADEIDYMAVDIPDGYGGEFDAPKRPRTIFLVAAVLALIGMLMFALLR